MTHRSVQCAVAVTNLQFELCVCSIIYDDFFSRQRANGRQKRMIEMIEFIDGFVTLSKINEPNVINIDAFTVASNYQNTRKIAFNSQNKIMFHCHWTAHWKTCGCFWKENTNEKNVITWQDFRSFCVCGDMTMTWGEEDAEPNMGKRNWNRMDLNQSPFVMAFVRMLMSYDRYRMMLIIIFVVTTTFSRRRSALCIHCTRKKRQKRYENEYFRSNYKHFPSLFASLGISVTLAVALAS